MSYSELANKILVDISKDEEVVQGLNKLRNDRENIDYESAQAFSKTLGRASARVMDEHLVDISSDDLSIVANEVVQPVYKGLQGVMQTYCDAITQNIANDTGLLYEVDAFEAINAEIDSMLTHLVERFETAEAFEDVKFLTETNAAQSITRKVPTTHMRATARSHERAGLSVYIARDEGSGCCDFCKGLVGAYESYDDLPSDFWMVHRNCTCVFHYKAGRTSDRIYFETTKNGLIKITEEE